jgi:hypothetical protein
MDGARCRRAPGRTTLNTVTHVLFESTLALGAILGLAVFALLVHWRRMLKPRPFLIGLGLSVALLIVQAAVVTRREHAERIMRAVERDIVASRSAALSAALSDRFRIAETGWDRADFLDLVERYMARVDVRTLRRRRLEIRRSEGNEFQIYVSYLADVSGRDFGTTVLTRWFITFVRENGAWRIVTIEPSEFDNRSVGGWRNIPPP